MPVSESQLGVSMCVGMLEALPDLVGKTLIGVSMASSSVRVRFIAGRERFPLHYPYGFVIL